MISSCLRTLALGLGILLVASGQPPELTAKGPVNKITISRFAWQGPIEVVEGEMLDLLSPWRDDFLGKHLPGQPANRGISMETGFQVWLYTEPSAGTWATQRPGLRPDPDGLELVYYVDYYPDSSGTSPGFILLHEESRTATLNNSTIIRATGWYEATSAWQRLMDSFSGPISPPLTGDGGLAAR